LAEGLQQSKACVVFLGPSGLGPWQKQELQVAMDKRAREETFHVIPVLLPGTERPRRGDVAHLEFLINASWVEFVKTLDDERAFQKLVWGITGTRAPEPEGLSKEGVCPYRGLESFRPEDASFFFGRDNLTGWLVSALRREVRSAQGVRFLGVLGPSGSGKSSVVLAGLVPQLKAGAIEGSERWPVAILRPGDDPLKNLAVGLVRPFRPAGALPDVEEARNLINNLRSDTQALDLFAQLALHDQPEEARLAVVVDQFEEVFTYRPQDDRARVRFEQDRDGFFANLLHAAATPGGRVAVVLTMRSDFLSACATFPQLAAVLSAHQELVGPMAAAELREVIEQPAFRVGCEVEPGLTERLLADVEGQPGALPLLQFALTEVWKKRDVRRLTLAAYTELGKDEKGEPRGIAGVLEQRANEIYRHLKPEEQEFCRRLFLRLVQPGEGTEDTKRRASYHELLPDDPVRAEAVKRLIRTLADRDARLIATEGTEETGGAVEVAHEALVRGWTQLRRWLQDEREGVRIHRRVTEAAKEWAEADAEHKDDYLYSGARLAVSVEWARSRRDELNAIEGAFLSCSEEAEQRRMEEELAAERQRKEAERQRKEEELAAERRHREFAEKAAHRQKLLSFLLLGAVLGTLGFGIFAGEQWRQANDNATQAKTNEEIADSRRVAAISEAERDKHLDRALLLAVEALRVKDTFEARRALMRGLLSRPEFMSFLPANEGIVSSLAFSPDGKILGAGLAADVRTGGVLLWDTARRERLTSRPLTVPEGYVMSVAFSPDGKTLAAGYGSGGKGGVVLWDAARREPLSPGPLKVPEGEVSSLAFSPDGTTLAASYGIGGRGGVVLWDAARREPLSPGPLKVPEGEVSSLAFSPDGTTLAAGYRAADKGGVMLWDAARREPLTPEPLKVPEGEVSSLAFSPNGTTLAGGYGGADKGSVLLWDAARRERLTPEPLTVPAGDVSSVAFSPDGKTLATGYGIGGKGRVLLCDVDLQSWRRLAGQVANRNFTRAEWRQYFPNTDYRPTFPDLPVPPETNPTTPTRAARDVPK
jgi:hypothetical protein